MQLREGQSAEIWSFGTKVGDQAGLRLHSLKFAYILLDYKPFRGLN